MIKWIALIALLGLPAYPDELQTSTTSPESSSIEDDLNPYVGILAGVATSQNSDHSSSEFGFEAGYQMRPFALAAEFSGSEYEENGDLKDKTNLLLKGQYYFSGDVAFTRYTFVGIGTGIIVRSDDTDFTLGPMAGLDVPLSKIAREGYLSLGAVAKYLFTDSTPTEGVALNGSLKYWF